MRDVLVNMSTWIWQHMPIPPIKFALWRSFLWWVRGKRTVAKIDGVTFDLDLGEMIDVCIYVRRFEKDVTRFIDATCQDGWVVLDVGANIGAHCLRFARIVGPKGRVYAFEPTNFAYVKLKRNVALNNFGNVHTCQIALSNQNLVQQKISYRSSWKSNGAQVQESSVVDFVRLDDWAAKNAIDHLDFIKIDVDGNEFSVLDGGRELLNKFKPMVIAEVGAWHFEDPFKNPWQILVGMGYRIWDVQTKEEYPNLASIRAKLPLEDKVMGFSINVVASTKQLPMGW